MTSRIESALPSSMTKRSNPKAIPHVAAPHTRAHRAEIQISRCFILADPEKIKDFALRVAPVDTNTAAADLAPIQHHVVGLRPDFQRIGLEQRQVFIQRRSKWMVHGHIAFLLVIVIQQGKIDHPQRPPCGGVDQIEFFSQEQPNPSHHIVNDRRFIGAE